MIEYSAIRDSLHTGDLVLFSGEGLESGAVKLATGTEWSHVGVVFTWASADVKMLLEAVRSGVGLIQLSRKIREYHGEVWIRRLSTTNRHYPRELAFIREVSDKPYEQHLRDLMGAAFDGLDDGVENHNSYFCSELAAEFYQRMGWLPNRVVSDSYAPSDFAGDLRLTGARFYDMEQVK